MLKTSVSPNGRSRRQSRAAERLISAAIDYCNADAIAVAARQQFAQLAAKHNAFDEICCIAPEQTDFDSDPPQALPRSKWCEHCRTYAEEAIDGASAKWHRRAARQRMRRAYRQVLNIRSSLPVQILELYQTGAINARFSCREIESRLSGIFSDTEVREGLTALVGSHHASVGDKRFKQLAKYRYEIVGL